ncbi:MAG TPA: hypothetical protein VH022_01640 [Candidatus Acidoferrum sp.]|nr:hypothetical protein [Candidatus Acidoferrum sp.]
MVLTSPTPNSSDESKTVFKNPLLYSSIVVVVAVVVVGWILFSRWSDTKQIERRANEEKRDKQHEADRVALDQMGGKTLDIQAFYANPGAVHRGETVQLCYGVANAKNVKLEPQPNPVWPSYARCVDIKPTKTTTYTLTIDDGAGNTKTQSLEVKVL